MSLSGAGVLGAGAVAGATVGALQAVRLKPSASEIKRVSDLTMSYFQKWKDGTFDGNNSVPRELSEEQQMIEDAIVKGVSENDTFEIFNENKRGWHRKGNDFLKIKNLKNINIYSNLEDWLVGNKADGYDVPGGWTYNKLQVGIPGNLNKMEIIVNLYNDEELTFYVPVGAGATSYRNLFLEWTSDGTTTYDSIRFSKLTPWFLKYQNHTGGWDPGFETWDPEHEYYDWYRENGYNKN